MNDVDGVGLFLPQDTPPECRVPGHLTTKGEELLAKAQATAVLGVEPDSNEPEVTAAYRRRLAAAKRDHKGRLAEQIESAYRQICSAREF